MSADQPYAVRELAETVGYELEHQAVPYSVHLDGFPDSRVDRVNVLMDPCGYVAAEGAQALPDDAVLRRTIFLCSQPPPTGEDVAELALLRRAGAVFALDQRAVLALHRLEIPARLLRPGYSRSLDRYDPAALRPIDVAFLGVRTARRAPYVASAARVLAHRACRWVVANRPPTAADGDADAPLARERWSLLAQAKVVICLHAGTDTRFAWREALDAIHAGAVVVSEHASGIAPLVPGEHLLVAAAAAVPDVADSLLRDPERLAGLRAHAYERLSGWIPYALPVSVLRAAIVELVGEPVPAGASLGTPRARLAA